MGHLAYRELDAFEAVLHLSGLLQRRLAAEAAPVVAPDAVLHLSGLLQRRLGPLPLDDVAKGAHATPRPALYDDRMGRVRGRIAGPVPPREHAVLNPTAGLAPQDADQRAFRRRVGHPLRASGVHQLMETLAEGSLGHEVELLCRGPASRSCSLIARSSRAGSPRLLSDMVPPDYHGPAGHRPLASNSDAGRHQVWSPCYRILPGCHSAPPPAPSGPTLLVRFEAGPPLRVGREPLVMPRSRGVRASAILVWVEPGEPRSTRAALRGRDSVRRASFASLYSPLAVFSSRLSDAVRGPRARRAHLWRERRCDPRVAARPQK